MASGDEKKIEIAKHDKAMAPMAGGGATMRWHDPGQAPFRLAGFGWWPRERRYRRMPLQPAEALPQAVDNLAWCTAGGQIAFRTDTGRVAVRVRLRARAGMVHMPATGQCGFDCYLGDPGQMVYHQTTKYPLEDDHYEILLMDQPRGASRCVTLNFPLYQGVEEVLVGLDPDAQIEPPPPFALERPVVVYGTSITQGGCASRPGMAYPNILGRRLNVEFINLGFSGSGRGEPEVARAIATLPSPALFVLDYEANSVDKERLRASFPEFIRILRDAHPRTPLLALSRIRYAAEGVSEKPRKEREERLALQRDAIAERRARGDAQVFFHSGADLLGEDYDECTVDGVHPTDLGFYRMARSLEPVLRKLLFG